MGDFGRSVNYAVRSTAFTATCFDCVRCGALRSFASFPVDLVVSDAICFYCRRPASSTFVGFRACKNDHQGRAGPARSPLNICRCAPSGLARHRRDENKNFNELPTRATKQRPECRGQRPPRAPDKQTLTYLLTYFIAKFSYRR